MVLFGADLVGRGTLEQIVEPLFLIVGDGQGRSLQRRKSGGSFNWPEFGLFFRIGCLAGSGFLGIAAFLIILCSLLCLGAGWSLEGSGGRHFRRLGLRGRRRLR